MNQKHRRPGVETEAPDANEIGHILARLPRKRKLAVMMMLATDLAQDECEPEPPDTLVPLTTAALAAYQLGPATVRAGIDSGELRGIQGSRRRVCVYALELIQWRDSRPVAPRPPRKSRSIPLENPDPIQQMLDAGELRATRGRR